MKLYAYALSLLLVGLALITFGAVRGNAQNKPTASSVTAAPAAPSLTDAQKIALLQSEVKVLEAQIVFIQATNESTQKQTTFNSSRDAFFQQFNESFKAAGVKSDDFDLDLASLTFKAKAKPEVKK